MAHISKETNRIIGNGMPAPYIIPMQKTRINELEQNFLTSAALNKNAYLPKNVNEILDSRASLIQNGINLFLNTIETGGKNPKKQQDMIRST